MPAEAYRTLIVAVLLATPPAEICNGGCWLELDPASSGRTHIEIVQIEAVS
jgi:hypothetical protein